MVLCDTNVCFKFLEGGNQVKDEFETIGPDNICFSIVSYAEAICINNKEEQKRVILFFSLFDVIPFDKDISKKFKELVSAHSPRTRWVPDAIIAATAITNSYELYTLNRKDFEFIDGLKLYNPRVHPKRKK